jgi:hypothetical protein
MTAREEHSRVRVIQTDRAAHIAALNDQLRCQARGGTLMATAGVIALGPQALPAILAAVRGFAEFTRGNDPHGEHDFGALTWRGTRLFWKIDCYDRDLAYGSPDPADPAVTRRVLTVMLAEEY